DFAQRRCVVVTPLRRAHRGGRRLPGTGLAHLLRAMEAIQDLPYDRAKGTLLRRRFPDGLQARVGIVEPHPDRVSPRQTRRVDAVVNQLAPDVEQGGPTKIAGPDELRLMEVQQVLDRGDTTEAI